MIRVAKILSIIVILFLFSSCYDEEQFAEVPRIEFRSLEFLDSPNSVGFDTLQLKFYFEDGDADFGLTEDDFVFSYDLYVDSEPKILTLDNLEEAVPPIFLAPVTTQNDGFVRLDGDFTIVNLPTDTYPALREDVPYTEEISLSCPNLVNQNGNFFAGNDVTVYQSDSIFFVPLFTENIDTTKVYPARFRESFYNLIVRFQLVLNGEPVVDEDGNPIFLDFGEVFGETDCGVGPESFNARVPLFDSDGKSGVITYNLGSALLKLGIGDNDFRLHFFVYDLAGNKSNVVISPTFRLSQITVN